MQPLGGCLTRIAAFNAATATRASIERLIALVPAGDDPVTGEVREDRIIMVAVGRGHKPPTALGLQVVLA